MTLQFPPPPRFTPADMDAAWESWGCNCGPSAVAAVCGLSLSDLRPHLGDFEAKRYTNPALMRSILNSLGVRARTTVRIGVPWPTYGLARVQWDGPWLAPSAPVRARYRFTHWVGVAQRSPDDIGIFDCNALANGTGWASVTDWESTIVPWILKEMVPRATGGWHLTHAVEIETGSLLP